MKVIKQANGLYRWFGVSSVNAKDRDDEIVSETAMEMDVHRTKMYGDDSTLNVFHIYDGDDTAATAIGGAPDYRAIVGGHLFETGEFYDTPLGRGFAKMMQEHPESTDGAGWGMSIGFMGMPNNDGVYSLVEIKERSVLPLSEAANPFTSFGVKEISKMALTDRQSAFLDQAKEMTKDPEVQAAIELMAAANKQSKALDAAGVQRKAALTPATSSVALQLGFKATDEDDAALAATAANLEVAATAVAQAQDAVAAVSTADVTEDTTGTDAAPADEMPTEQAAADDATDDAPTDDSAAKPAVDDETLKQIAAYVDQKVASAMEEVKALIAGSAKSMAGEIAKSIAGNVEELRATAIIKAYNEQPAPSVLERLNAFSATKSATTIPADSNPLLAKQGQNLPTDDEYTSEIARKLGFEPQK